MPGVEFPLPPFQWPHVGRQWPAWNIESDQADGLVMWMPWGGGTVPGGHSYIDQIGGLMFTKAGTPAWIADGERGWSMLFDDGSSENLQASFSIAPPLAMACWAMPDDALYEYRTLMTAFGGPSDYYNLLTRGYSGTNRVLVTSKGDATGTASISTGWAADVWYHFCAVFAATNSRTIYQDAPAYKATDTTAVTVDPAPTEFYIGNLGTSGGYFSGRLSDVRLYNRGLTDAQVAAFVHPDTKFELFQIPRRLWRLGVVAPPPATIVPVAMHHYRSARL